MMQDMGAFDLQGFQKVAHPLAFARRALGKLGNGPVNSMQLRILGDDQVFHGVLHGCRENLKRAWAGAESGFVPMGKYLAAPGIPAPSHRWYLPIASPTLGGSYCGGIAVAPVYRPHPLGLRVVVLAIAFTLSLSVVAVWAAGARFVWVIAEFEKLAERQQAAAVARPPEKQQKGAGAGEVVVKIVPPTPPPPAGR